MSGEREPGASSEREPRASEERERRVSCEREGIWREYINTALGGSYQQLFAMVDQLIMLKAPSFDAVFQWRWQQEMKLIEKYQNTGRSGLMTKQQVLKFIQYFQRITEQSLGEMPMRSQHVFQLELDRQISRYSGAESSSN